MISDENALENFKRSGVGGRVYWNPKTTRVWLNNGHVRDMGLQSYEAARKVAENLGFRFHELKTRFM